MSNFLNYYEKQPNDECVSADNNTFICALCGKKLPIDLIGNSGTFCIRCEKEYDLD